MKKLVLVMAAVIAAGCAKGSTEPELTGGAATLVSVGDTVRLKFGESATVAQSGLRVQFRTLVGDSRCPIDALCVWAGDAHVQIAVITALTTHTYDLHSFLEPKVAQHGLYRFRLVELGPSRQSTDSVRTQDYYIKLEVTRTN